jgi:hypothetical protein
MKRRILRFLAACAIVALSTTAESQAQALPSFEIDPEAARSQDRVYQQIRADQQRQYNNCLSVNRRTYLENRANPLCTLFGKCEPALACQKPSP